MFRCRAPTAYVLAALVLVAAGCGTGDITGENCGRNAFGQELCGDELVAFCEERYDPELNAEACEPALRDAGIDPDELLAERAAERQRRKRERLLRGRIRAELNQPVVLRGIEYTLTAVRAATAIDADYETVRPKAGNRFLVLDVAYRNVGRRPIDLECALEYRFTLVDRLGRTFEPDGEAMISAPENAEGCGEPAQPGETGTAAVLFDISRNVKPRRVRVEDPEGKRREDGGDWLEYLISEPA